MYISEMAKDISQRTGIPTYKVKTVLKQLQVVMRERILFGENVTLHNIGKFKLTVRKEFIHKSNLTKEQYKIPKRYGLSFKPSEQIRKDLYKKTVY